MQGKRQRKQDSVAAVPEEPREEVNLSHIQKLLSCKDNVEIEMTIDMEYSDWQGEIDLAKIIQEMGDCTDISEEALSSIVEKLK